jgi:asparagine synthase (glutamine-hydrolysing)
MCGISGVFRPNAPPKREELESMNECLCHRGPDDEGYYQDGSLGFAHRRLSIIGLTTGQQPITSEDGSVVVIFNGEIYNYRSLRKTLTRRGHVFSTETDTEVLVHAYEEYGVNFLEQLSGMFAFALWDRDHERLVLARDPMGIKPLYVTGTNGNSEKIAFGSELPAVLAADIPHGGLDREALARYFAFGFVPAPRTAFSNISALQPGECLIIDADGRDRTRYYEPTVSNYSPSIDAAAVELRNRVESAVERRLMADVPLGAFLSGGIDSSIIVGTMANLLDESVKTFTVGFEESLFDESSAARKVAQYHDTDHHEQIVSASEVRDLIPEVLGQLGQPFADQSLIPTYVVARETSDEVKVALSGDGADELFAGYDKYLGEYYSRYYRAVPGPVRRGVIEPLVDAVPTSRESGVGEFARKLKKFTRGGVTDTPVRHAQWLRIADREADRAAPSLDIEGAGVADLRAEHDRLNDFFDDQRDDLDDVLAVDTRYTLSNQILRKVDLASMYNSLEVRVPFLDTGIVEYTASLPIEYKMTRNSRKRVLKRAFNDVLPQQTLNRSKQGFDMPIGEWFKTDLADEFDDRINGLNTDLIDTRAVQDIYADHQQGGEHGKFLWTVYVFAVWVNRMEDQGVLDSI